MKESRCHTQEETNFKKVGEVKIGKSHATIYRNITPLKPMENDGRLPLTTDNKDTMFNVWAGVTLLTALGGISEGVAIRLDPVIGLTTFLAGVIVGLLGVGLSDKDSIHD